VVFPLPEGLTMVRFLLALVLFFAAEGAALACSCMRAPDDPRGARTLGRSLVEGGIAIVEVELVAPYDERRGRGEQLRVRRTLAGRAPARFEVARQGRPSSASCDTEFQRGRRTMLLLYPAQGRGARGVPRHRISASCTSYLLADPNIRAAAVGALGRRDP